MTIRRATSVLAALLAAAGTAFVGAGPASAATTYEVKATIAVGASPYTLALNPVTHTVYVANYTDGTVSVIDEATNAVVRTIPVGSSPEDITIDPRTDTVYTANDGDNTVSVIDGATNSVIETLTDPSLYEPYSIAIAPRTGTLYVGNYNHTISVFDAKTSQFVTSFDAGGIPNNITPGPRQYTAYASTYNDGESVYFINGFSAPQTIDVPDGPYGLGTDFSRQRLYVTNYDSNGLTVINTRTNAIVKTIQVGSGPDFAAVDHSTHQVFVGADDGTLSVVAPITGHVTQALTGLGSNLNDGAVDPSNDTLYMVDVNSNTIYAIGPSS